MMRIKAFRYILAAMLVSALSMQSAAQSQSVRKERILISEGNKLFSEGKYLESAAKYQQALEVNPASAVASYNYGLSQIKQVKNPKDTVAQVKAKVEQAASTLKRVADLGAQKPGLASKANYNLGNISFNQENYKEAVDYYKQSLRLDPADEQARKNLRIAQKKLEQQQNQDQNKDQNQDKDKNQDKDQDKDNDKDQNKDNKQDQRDQKQDQQPKQNQIDRQTADQILNANNNRESATRAKYNASKADQKAVQGQSRKNW